MLLICSSGGHLYQLFNLHEYWSKYQRSWITFESEDVRSLLADEQVITAFHPTTRNIKNFFRNLWLAARVLREIKPRIIVSTGAGIAVPFFYMAKLYGIRTVYVESITRLEGLSLTGRLVYPIASHFIVQSPELASKLPRAEYKGWIL